MELESRLGREYAPLPMLVDVVSEAHRQTECDIPVQVPRRLADNEDTPNQLHLFIGDVRLEQLVRGHQCAGHVPNV